MATVSVINLIFGPRLCSCF